MKKIDSFNCLCFVNHLYIWGLYFMLIFWIVFLWCRKEYCVFEEYNLLYLLPRISFLYKLNTGVLNDAWYFEHIVVCRSLWKTIILGKSTNHTFGSNLIIRINKWWKKLKASSSHNCCFISINWRLTTKFKHLQSAVF